MKNGDWIDIYNKDNPKGFIIVCESGRRDLLTYYYNTKEEAENGSAAFNCRIGNRCLAIIEI